MGETYCPECDSPNLTVEQKTRDIQAFCPDCGYRDSIWYILDDYAEMKRTTRKEEQKRCGKLTTPQSIIKGKEHHGHY